jgi:hypothetical protein
VRINCIVLGFAPMNRFPIEGMPSDESHPCCCTAGGQPIPGAPTLNAAADIFFIGSNAAHNRFRRRRQILMDKFGALLLQDTDVQRSCLSIDATIVFMLLCVAVPPAFLLGVEW